MFVIRNKVISEYYTGTTSPSTNQPFTAMQFDFCDAKRDAKQFMSRKRAKSWIARKLPGTARYSVEIVNTVSQD